MTEAAAPEVPTVLFLCVHNAGRSQMALGWFNHLAGDRALAFSGGSEPGDRGEPVRHRRHGRGRHRHLPGVPEAVDRRDRPGRRRRRHHGLRRRLPDLPGQAVRGLEARRPVRQERGRGATDARQIGERVRGLLVSLGIT